MHQIFLHFLVLIATIAFCDYTSFANKTSYQIPFSELTQVSPNKKTAVVVGAGPAGLVAAKILSDANYHAQIVIVEKRDVFNRFNLVNYFPEALPMLEQIGLKDALRSIGTHLHGFSFFIERPSPETNIDFTQSKEADVKEFDFSRQISEAFANPGLGMHVVNIAQIQSVFTQILLPHESIKFIQGECDFAMDKESKQEKYKVKIYQKNNREIWLEPDLIVIADGAKSTSRDRLKIKMEPILKPILYCSGSLDISPVEGAQNLSKLHVLSQDKNRAFGNFNAIANRLFINGEAFPNETADQCLLRNAKILLEQNLGSPIQKEPILATRYKEVINIIPSKSSEMTKGSNLILIGDSAGYGTPKGGIGLSLVLTYYAYHFKELISNWKVHEDRALALKTYARKTSEVVDYWHEKIADRATL